MAELALTENVHGEQHRFQVAHFKHDKSYILQVSMSCCLFQILKFFLAESTTAATVDTVKAQNQRSSVW